MDFQWVQYEARITQQKTQKQPCPRLLSCYTFTAALYFLEANFYPGFESGIDLCKICSILWKRILSSWLQHFHLWNGGLDFNSILYISSYGPLTEMSPSHPHREWLLANGMILPLARSLILNSNRAVQSKRNWQLQIIIKGPHDNFYLFIYGDWPAYIR